MKYLLGFGFFLNFYAAGLVNAAPIPVSVVQFQDKTSASNCRYNWTWWGQYLGDGFKDMLLTELARSDKVRILERETIQKIYESEIDLVNSDDSKTAKRGQFKKAKYTFVGAVTEFEYCSQRKASSLNVGAVAGLFGLPAPDVHVGIGGTKAKVTVDLRIVDVSTGQVVKVIQASEPVEDSKFELDTEYGSHEQEQNSPADRAARGAIQKAAKSLLSAL